VPGTARFEDQNVVYPEVADKDENGNDALYVAGWVYVPASARRGINALVPVLAVDAAFGKKPGMGSFFVAATLDAGRLIHAVAVAHLLCAENEWGYDILFQTAAKAFEDEFLTRQFVIVKDGNRGISKAVRGNLPNSNLLRCSKHLQSDFQKAGPAGMTAYTMYFRNFRLQPELRSKVWRA